MIIATDTVPKEILGTTSHHSSMLTVAVDFLLVFYSDLRV